ncbi:MAG: tail fiber domain-containing protein [Planctomycetes bacterium]|nr:tail fiber domain-containing protein [Planctomycetota bacterium]
MKTKPFARIAITAALACVAGTQSAIAGPVSTSFTYQGKLFQGLGVVDEFADIQFSLFDSEFGGSQIGATQSALNVNVDRGLFTTQLNFGSAAFAGDARWLQIAVRVPAGSGSYVPLTTRQPLTAAPYAIHALGPWAKGGTNLSYSGGNVGIGETNPLAALGYPSSWQGLHIDGTPAGSSGCALIEGSNAGRLHLRAATNAAGNKNFVIQNTNSAFAMSWLNDNLSDRLQVMQIMPDGNVGLGVAAPTSKLSVAGGITAGSSAPSHSQGVHLEWNRSGNEGESWLLNQKGLGSGGIRFGEISSANVATERMRIDSLGNVGIGTASPVDRLTVGGIGAAISVVDGGARLLMSVGGGTGIVGTSTPQPLVLESFGIERVRVQTDGRVVMGMNPVADPGYSMLEVNGNNANVAARIQNDKVDSSAMLIYSTAPSGVNDALTAYVESPTGRAVYARTTSFTGSPIAIMGECQSNPNSWAGYFNGRGFFSLNVGIGRTPVVNKLEVEGNASKTTASSWLANSDARIKTGIQTVHGALDLLDRVRPVTFEYADWYKAEHPTIENRRYFNVIAQEFAQVFPECVKPGGDKLPNGEDVLQVDTYPLTICSVAAVKELNTIVKDQAVSISALRAENQRLQEQLRKLSDRVSALAK